METRGEVNSVWEDVPENEDENPTQAEIVGKAIEEKRKKLNNGERPTPAEIDALGGNGRELPERPSRKELIEGERDELEKRGIAFPRFDGQSPLPRPFSSTPPSGPTYNPEQDEKKGDSPILWMGIRQSLIIALGAIEDYLGIERTKKPNSRKVGKKKGG